MSKPESRFRQAVHNKLPATVFHEASSALYSNGTPDDYYESKNGCCRIEYKHYEKIPSRAPMSLTKEIGKARKSKLSAAQQRWLRRSYNNGMPTYVIVGFGSGKDMRGVVLSALHWEDEVSVEWIKEHLRTTRELADLITNHLIARF